MPRCCFEVFLPCSHLWASSNNSEEVNVSFSKMTTLLVLDEGKRMKIKPGTTCSQSGQNARGLKATLENSQIFQTAKYGYEFVTEHRNVIKISRLKKKLKILLLEMKNNVAKITILSQLQYSQKELLGRSMSNLQVLFSPEALTRMLFPA